MHMDWLMLVGVEVEDKTEVFVYFRHNLLCYFRLQRYELFRMWQNFYFSRLRRNPEILFVLYMNCHEGP